MSETNNIRRWESIKTKLTKYNLVASNGENDKLVDLTLENNIVLRRHIETVVEKCFEAAKNGSVGLLCDKEHEQKLTYIEYQTMIIILSSFYGITQFDDASGVYWYWF